MTRMLDSEFEGCRAKPESGAAMAEMAILMPLLVLLIIGIFELGAVFKDFLTTSDSVRVGTRVLSARGDDQFADCNALKAAVDSMAVASTVQKIESIEIFQADSNGDQIAGKTNTYLFTGNSGDRCTLSTNPLVEFEEWRVDSSGVQYPSIDRTVLVGGGPLDLVGMKITYSHDWMTGFPPFRGSVTIDEETIVRLEPQGVTNP